MSTRTARVRLLAAAGAVLAALALPACRNGEGVRDEGPSSSRPHPGASTRDGTAAHGSDGHRRAAAQASGPVAHPLPAVTADAAPVRET